VTDALVGGLELVSSARSVRVFMNYCAKNNVRFGGVFVIDLVVQLSFFINVISFHGVH
jgi:hypothetical protein